MILRLALVVGLLVEAVLAHSTLLVDHGSTTSQESPILLTNATASIVNTGIAPKEGRSFFTISEMSGLSLLKVSLVTLGYVPAVVYGNGDVLITSVVIPTHTSIATLYHSTGIDSTIAIKNSELTDMIYEGMKGTLLSSGYIEIQEVRSCSFTNVSRPNTVTPSYISISEDCTITDTVMSETEDTFYNYIVTGPTVFTTTSLPK